MAMRVASILLVSVLLTSTAGFAPLTEHRNHRVVLQAASIDDEQQIPVSKTSKQIMSQAIPFLECPKGLVESDIAGNFGFDPLGFCKNDADVLAYREAEVRHSRLAMLAAAGWPLSELWDRQIAEFLGMPSALDSSDRVPSILNGGLDRVSMAWWGCCLGLTMAIEQYAITKSREGNPKYFPGNLGFDPLNLYPKNPEGQKQMQLSEIKHGRLAMVAIVGFAIQEYVTSLGVIDETPLFFKPLAGLI